VKIGEGATVGIGSVVMRNVAPAITVFGVPAVQLKII
jgi:serine acetyltransferase